MTRWCLILLLAAGCPPVDPIDSGDSDPGVDADHDGVVEGLDCDDADPDVFPGADERCNGEDDDCDGAPAQGEGDVDGDGERDCVRCEAAGWWRDTRELQGAVLANRVGQLTDGLSCSYTSTTTWMFLDLDNHDGRVACVYTGRVTEVTDTKPDPNTDMNTEHSWPRSEGADLPPAQCDLHHLYPSDVAANSARANHPFGVVTSGVTWSVGGSLLGVDAGGNTVFEPRDAHKGNVARSMLYFASRYGFDLDVDQRLLFQAWHAADPVDAAEWARSQAIEAHQAHVNPYVACVDLVERL